jgi:hypothetical protein
MNIKELRERTLSFVSDQSSLHPTDTYNIQKSLKVVVNKQIIDDILFNVSLRGFPEKAQFLNDRSSSYNVMMSTIKDIIQHDVNNKLIYVSFCESKFSQGIVMELFGKKIHCWYRDRLDFITTNSNPEDAASKILTLIGHVTSSGSFIDTNMTLTELGKGLSVSNESNMFEQSKSSSHKTVDVNKSDKTKTTDSDLTHPCLSMWHKKMSSTNN